MPAVGQRKRPTDIVLCWDGTEYSYRQRREAQKMEKDGLLQIAENIQAHDLKHPSDFTPKVVDKQDYDTREMKAK